MAFGGFKRGARIKANRSYYCPKCSMEWAAIPPEKTPNKKGKLVATKEATEKVKTCPSCGHKEPYFLASGKEAARHRELRRALQAGLISDLELQPRFPLVDGIEYRADFAYTDESGKRIFEDTKGFKTEKFKDRMKLMKHFHKDIDIILL